MKLDLKKGVPQAPHIVNLLEVDTFIKSCLQVREQLLFRASFVKYLVRIVWDRSLRKYGPNILATSLCRLFHLKSSRELPPCQI